MTKTCSLCGGTGMVGYGDNCGCNECKVTVSPIPWQCLEEARQIQADHAYGAEADAGFDGGEFSGPEHVRMEDEALHKLAQRYDVDFDDMMYVLSSGEMMTEDEAAGYGDSQER